MPNLRVDIDLNTFTVGEMMDIELASGRSFLALARSKTGQVMIAAYRLALQQHADAIASLSEGEPRPKPPNWKAMERMTPSALLQYVSPGSVDSD